MAKRLSRDAKCIALGAIMATCAMSTMSFVRVKAPVPVTTMQQRQDAKIRAYEQYYEAAENLIRDLIMDADPYGDRFDTAEYAIARDRVLTTK